VTLDQARTLIGQRFATVQVEPAVEGGPIVLTMPVDQWTAFAQFAKYDLRCRFFSFLSAVDWKDQGLEVVARLDNVDDRIGLMMKTRLGPGVSACPSITPIFRGANWMEREAYDMFGIRFEGHPDLRRILLSDDWEGHPLLKSYAVDTPHPPYR
jgi:NADH:ubiquinone oxidoreductase subunit C